MKPEIIFAICWYVILTFLLFLLLRTPKEEPKNKLYVPLSKEKKWQEYVDRQKE